MKKRYFKYFLPAVCILAMLFLAGCASRAFASEKEAEHVKSFTQFRVALPEGWDGDEQTGFISDSPEEYLLTLGKKDAEGDTFLAQITIFLLPNKPKAGSRDAAAKLAESQGNASEPALRGNFWVFTGEPRSRVVKGEATTMVNASPERLLIIIAQDPQNLGASEIVKSLRALTPEAKELLGR